jgi:hypothetical protein
VAADDCASVEERVRPHAAFLYCGKPCQFTIVFFIFFRYAADYWLMPCLATDTRTVP